MVNPRAYVPQFGDVVWITLNPQAGREQGGRRPAVVLSPRTYNGKTGLLLACPITSQVKGYPFEVILPDGLPVSGALLVDQTKSLDWQVRDASFICTVPSLVLGEALGKLIALLSTK